MTTGFLEESPGVKSSARLAALIMVAALFLFTLAIGFAIVYAAMHPEGRDGLAGIIGAAVGYGIALGATVFGALKARSAAGAVDNGAM